MTDEEIVKSAEQVRLAELHLAQIQEANRQERWRLRHEFMRDLFLGQSWEGGLGRLFILAGILFILLPVFVGALLR